MNMKTYTREFVKEALKEIDPEKDFSNLSFIQSDEITLLVIMQSKLPLVDKIYFFCYKAATTAEAVPVNLFFAEIVLPICEKEHPKDTLFVESLLATKAEIGPANMYDLLEKVVDMGREIEKYNGAAAYAAYAVCSAVSNYTQFTYGAVDSLSPRSFQVSMNAADEAATLIKGKGSDATLFMLTQVLIKYAKNS